MSKNQSDEDQGIGVLIGGDLDPRMEIENKKELVTMESTWKKEYSKIKYVFQNFHTFQTKQKENDNNNNYHNNNPVEKNGKKERSCKIEILKPLLPPSRKRTKSEGRCYR